MCLGGRYVPPQLAAKTLAWDRGSKLLNPRKTGLDRLTARDRQVLDYLASGLSNKEIAKILNASSSTVTKTVSRIFRFLNVRNRTEAANVFKNQHF